MFIEKWCSEREVEPLRHIHDEVDRLFYGLFKTPGPFQQTWKNKSFWGDIDLSISFTPNLNMRETDEAYLLTVDLPGVSKNEVDVSAEEGSVTICGERKLETEQEGECFHCREAASWSFKRTLSLPNKIDATKVDAKMKDGILTVVLPKTEEAKRKTNKVEVF